MGTKKSGSPAKPPSSLAGALFSATQQRVLGLLFGQPDRSFFARELIKLAKAGSGAAQRELAGLEQSGLVTARRVGNQKHYQANPDSPIFDELVAIIRKTVGLAEPLREALRPFADRITAAFVYGSVARKEDKARSDIDLMILSDDVAYPDLYGALQAVESTLGRSVNPTLYTRSDWTARRHQRNSFVIRVLAQPKLWLVGGESDIAAGEPGPGIRSGAEAGTSGRA